MKPRTAHSLAGMRRYLQMSGDRVFIFVEGRDLDPNFYSRICGPVCKDAGHSYQILVADLIVGGGGGKNILTQLFGFLRDNNSLLDRSGPHSKLIIFYLDKDVDDIFHSWQASDHVVYTIHHSVENHLFDQGDIVSSIATAGSVDVDLIRNRIKDPVAWRARVANCWRDWVTLCLLARALSLRGPVSYRARDSQINSPADSATDAAGLSALVAQMHAASGLPMVSFHRKLRAAYRLVDLVYRKAQGDLIFKGKWYSVFALRELELASAGQPYNQNGAADRLMGSLVATTNFDVPWAEHFRGPLRAGLARL